MKQNLCCPYLLITLLVFCTSCSNNLYHKPLLINKVASYNKVGATHETKFNDLNQAYLASLASIQAAYGAIVIDTTNQEGKEAYTFEATLQRKSLNEQFDLHHTIYLRPAGSSGPVDRNFGEIVYFTNDSLFFAKSSTSKAKLALMGPCANFMPTKKLLPPRNVISTTTKRFAVDSVTFGAGLTKQQRRFFKHIINNAFVVRQDKGYDFNLLKNKDFNFYSNYLKPSDPQPADYSVNFKFIPDPASDKMLVKLSYHGKEVNVQVPSDLPTELSFPLSVFEQGNVYEANFKLSLLIQSFILRQYMFD